MDIEIPNNWGPRAYQSKLWNYLMQGGTRAVAVWHRRAGKDSLSLNWTVLAAMERVGVYWHMLPTAAQARKVVWDSIDKQGRRVIDQVFPPEIRKSTNNQEMKIELISGSIWQCVGSDNYNSLVGANPIGVVFSEYSLADPAAWDFIRPILAENGGWSLFIYTPRGKNHGYDLFDMAKNNPKWFCQKLGVNETNVISLDIIDEERTSGMDEDAIQQEFYCSFDAAVKGMYYDQIFKELEATGQIGNIPYVKGKAVYTAWDLGVGDATGIWFWQINGEYFDLIDYYEGSGVGADTYTKVLQDKGYIYNDRHIFPHDIEVREWTNGLSRKKTLENLGIRVKVAPKMSVDDGINAVRMILPRCRFDAVKCKRGIEALRQYHKKWNDAMKTYMPTPCHDWTSHGADAFRYFAIVSSQKKPTGFLQQIKNEIQGYDPLGSYFGR